MEKHRAFRSPWPAEENAVFVRCRVSLRMGAEQRRIAMNPGRRQIARAGVARILDFLPAPFPARPSAARPKPSFTRMVYVSEPIGIVISLTVRRRWPRSGGGSRRTGEPSGAARGGDGAACLHRYRPEATLCSIRSLSATMAMNSEFVGFDLEMFTV